MQQEKERKKVRPPPREQDRTYPAQGEVKGPHKKAKRANGPSAHSISSWEGEWVVPRKKKTERKTGVAVREKEGTWEGGHLRCYMGPKKKEKENKQRKGGGKKGEKNSNRCYRERETNSPSQRGLGNT